MHPSLGALLIILSCGLTAWVISWWVRPRQSKSRPADSRPSSKMLPVDPVPAPPELSCFAKGIIRSMRETPDQWMLGHNWCQHHNPEHTQTNICDLRLFTNTNTVSVGSYSTTRTYWYIENHPISNDECAAITSQGIAYLQSLKDQKAEAKRAAARAPFERLGCPSSNS